MWKWFLLAPIILFGSVALAGFIKAAFAGSERKLNEWARSVSLTETQQSAMWELWEVFKTGNVPDADPLSRLSEENLNYIKQICSPDYRPAAFNSGKGGDVVRIAQFKYLTEKGYNPTQTAVLVGMTLNKVGRRDI